MTVKNNGVVGTEAKKENGMTRDEIIRLARSVGIHRFKVKYLARFVDEIAAAEREACAVIVETPIAGEQDDITMEAKDRVAAAIRARGSNV